MAKSKLRRINADPKVLNSLLQFQPPENFDIDHVDDATGRYRSFSADRDKEIRSVLSAHMQPHVGTVQWNGKAASLERFLENAIGAIWIYLDQRNEQSKFDRQKAKAILLETAELGAALQHVLRRITEWRELSNYLEQLFVRGVLDLGHQNSPKADPAKSRKPQLRKKLISALNEFRGFSPHSVDCRLIQLVHVLTLAAERVQLQPGDYQRDEVAQRFTDDMAFAWVSGTGKVPTYSKPTQRLKNPSPFAAMLAAINNGVFPAEIRSANDFRDHAIKSIAYMKDQFPELVSGNPPRRRRGAGR